jgi:hypothetical protein
MISMISSPLSAPPTLQRPTSRTHSESKYELWIVLAALTLLYGLAVLVTNRRFVWFDELFTLDIAKASTVPKMWEMIRRVDFQLPGGFLLSRASMAIFGQNKLGLRFPSMVEFYIGSMALFFYVRRKVGIAYAAVAMLILWKGVTFHYAVEARPYALLLMFFSLLLLCWDIATYEDKRTLALWGVAIANLGMLTSHIFGPVSLFPFLAAEAVRFYRIRKPDFALWAGLLLPLTAMVFYLPLVGGYTSLVFPPAFQASLIRIPHFYTYVIAMNSVAVCVAIFVALLVPQGKSQFLSTPRWKPEELVLFGLIFLNPVLLNIVLMRRHGAFWDRYVITTEAVIYIGIAILVGSRLTDRYAGYAAAAVLLIFLIQDDVLAVIRHPLPPDASALALIRPDLPLVAAGGVAFFEMNHYEKPDMLARLYFLKNRPIALSYTHTNLFEDRGFPDRMDPGFPISANVANYADFLHQHREFLVLGSYDAPEEWLLRKLRDDGARLTWLGFYPGPYIDTNLYLVDVAAGTGPKGLQ